MPRWLRGVGALLGIYVALVAAAALWLPHEWDWDVFQWLSSHAQPGFSRRITIVDVAWNTRDVPSNRRLLATFLDQLNASGQRPEAVIIDVEFDPCQTQPCSGPMEAARQQLAASIRAAVKRFAVYATEEPPVDRDDLVTGPLDRHDDLIYAALTGAAHTRMTVVPGAGGVSYRLCYPDVRYPAVSGAFVATQSVWSMVERVLPDFSASPCNQTHVAVRVGPPLRETRIIAYGGGSLPSNATFDKQYVIVGTLGVDRSAFIDRSGPELLAWALSNQLEFGSANGAHTAYAAQPQNGLLLVVVPAFSALTSLAFMAVFYPLKRTRLRSFRHRLPAFAAIASALVGLAAFAGFEVLMFAAHQIYPQVSLIAFGIVVAATLGGVRAYQMLIDQSNAIEVDAGEAHDYDVFISYAHDEGAWVAEHVYAAFRDARRADGSKLSVFFDTDSIRAGTAWQQKLALAIEGSRFIVPVYSETYFTKPYCRFEIMRAHRKWVLAGSESRCVLPVMRGHPKIMNAVDDIQAVSVDDQPDIVQRHLDEVLAALSRD